MQRHNGFFRLGALLLLVGWVLAQNLQAQQWQRLPLEGGGVVWDVAEAKSWRSNMIYDPVWAACGNSGIYRAHWVSYQDGWSEWDEYLTGKFANGVDVIFTFDDGDTIEHVLASTTNWGLFYETSTSGYFDDSWDRPNENTPYPPLWEFTGIRDAAFYCPPSGVFPSTPDTAIYVLLIGQPDGSTNPGLYRWSSSNPTGFVRFDDETEPRFYDHFYRDLADSNLLWLVRKADKDGDPAGALLKLSGAYGAAPVEVDVTGQSGTLLDVYGFSPWYLGGTPPERYVYVLAKWTDGEHILHSVFVLDESDPGNDFAEKYRLPDGSYGDTDDEVYIADDFPFKGVVGKPYTPPDSTLRHHLWLTASGYGAWFVQTNPGSVSHPDDQIQINGGQQDSLMRWDPRFFYRDWLHQGLDSTNIILGTHQHGVWFLKFLESDLDGYKWIFEKEGFYGSEVRDIQLFYVGTEQKILAPTYNLGVFKWTGSAWIEGGTSTTSLDDDPRFNKGIYAGFELGTTAQDAVCYFGSLPEPIIRDAFGTPDTTYQGGLFRFDDDQQTTWQNFIPGMADADVRKYTVSDIDGYVKTNGDYVVYLCTGHFGEGQAEPFLDYNVVCRKYTTNWSLVYQYTSSNMGLLCVEPDPRNPDSSVFVGTGNLWTWPPVGANSNYWGKVKNIHHNGSTWVESTVFTIPDTFYSVMDLTSMIDPQFSVQANRVLAYIAFAKGSELRSAASHYNEGTIMQYKWKPQTSTYDTTRLYSASNPLPDVNWLKPPAAVAVKCYKRGNSPILVALVQGDVVAGEPIVQSHVYKYTQQGWELWYTPTVEYGNPMVSGLKSNFER